MRRLPALLLACLAWSGCALSHERAPIEEDGGRRPRRDAGPPAPLVDAGPVRDGGPLSPVVVQTVLVSYTALAREDALSLSPSLAAHASSLVDEANEAYENSRVFVRLELAGVVETDAAIEALGTLEGTVGGVGRAEDGIYDELHAQRNEASADLVVVMLGGGFCGGGAMAVTATAESAFCVVGVCPSGAKPLSFVHEIGHLQGAWHEGPTPASLHVPEGFAFDRRSYACARSLGASVTVMYSGSRGGDRVPFFTSPHVRFDGAPTGTAECDNVRRINETAERVAAFR